ncbi:D-amino-acid transaminase [Ochrobactrum sp. WV_118_8]|uniref:Probable branched-chain-amino-acid aminotransferase n=1 Tax=Brucella anthropi TaxID=529 RepID=A0A6I0DVF1_BRUAN|nr:MULTISPECIES: D-amino-acid transaminase [Brucella/Ochrobactrum group]MCR5941924.1 D-amino-acid transaminase [Ochrobactrum sp. XJ1]QTN05006.1 D-amino-acid transaminase [Ochrobactrum sp. EEELCW01]KAB2740293.1 D-amino-acid transaminase [Brucella anthropi]KAB2757614.1 D-amino-acid transaminase [Brucella anthropi]KAB2766607.1 D-amino-acid transaminase [Brucella anthropi]
MARVIYLNGAFVAENEAKVSVFDRGFLFGDGIYEVSAVIDGRLVDNELHLARLERSVRELGIPLPASLDAIRAAQIELMKRNELHEGVVYMQVTRGEAERDFVYTDDIKPNFVMFTQAKNLASSPSVQNGVRVDVAPDTRWARRDIKTVMLLAQVLAKKQAKSKGYHEVWLVEDGFVTEGGSSTAFIITNDNVLVTRPNSHAILPGCTRRAVIKIAEEQHLRIEERLFTVDEAKAAKEAFLTSASSFVTPIIGIQDHTISDGKPGPITRRLQEIYMDMARTGSEPVLQP